VSPPTDRLSGQQPQGCNAGPRCHGLPVPARLVAPSRRVAVGSALSAGAPGRGPQNRPDGEEVVAERSVVAHATTPRALMTVARRLRRGRRSSAAPPTCPPGRKLPPAATPETESGHDPVTGTSR